MSVRVDPDALRRFAQNCRATAGELEGLAIGDVDATVRAALPGSLTQPAAARVGSAVQAAVDVVAGRHRNLADKADGSRDDYVATDQQIRAGFDAMSHP